MSFSSLFESGQHMRNKSHFASLVAIAVGSDNTIGAEEEKMLTRFKNRLDITDADYATILKNPKAVPVTPPTTSEERIQWLHDLFKIVFANHHMSDREYALLKRYATAIGYNEEDSAYLVKRSIEIFSGHLTLEDYRYLLNKDR